MLPEYVVFVKVRYGYPDSIGVLAHFLVTRSKQLRSHNSSLKYIITTN